MAWVLEPEELRRASDLDSAARYAYAIDKFREHYEVWVLMGHDGWVVGTDPDSVRVFPVWPHAELAAAQATEEWEDARATSLSLQRFLDLVAQLARQVGGNLAIGVFPTTEAGVRVSRSTFAAHIRNEPRETYKVAPFTPRQPRTEGVRKNKTARRGTPNLVRYVTQQDLDVVIGRVPAEYRERLRDVFQSADSLGVRQLGSVTRRGRRDINLSANLPPRVSLGRYLVRGQSAAEFGAPEQGQWPPWAVRRFLLYDVFLHELGHLQVAQASARNPDRRFAGETRAQEFSDEMRRSLYSEPFEHPDPVHNAPTSEELSLLESWSVLDKVQRLAVVQLVLSAPHHVVPDLLRRVRASTDRANFLRLVLAAKPRTKWWRSWKGTLPGRADRRETGAEVGTSKK